jgi:L-ascorbate metabolism protein UlaG (beta-lactamase superfamily)
MARLATQIDPAWLHREPDLVRGGEPETKLALQWLGTAGFRVVYRGYAGAQASRDADPASPGRAGPSEHHVWLDPHLSRHSLWQIVSGKISANAERIDADVDRADAVVVGHSHFDHAIDAPYIAKKHRARLYGSSSMMAIGRGYGVDEADLRCLEPGVTVHDGPCALTAYRSQHSRFLLGRVPAPGHITAPLAAPARALDYRVGDVLGLHLGGGPVSVYHVGSADLIEAEMTGVRADVVLACTIGRHATPRFTERLLDTLQPKIVIPCHWDQFWRPIDAEMRQIPSNDLAGFIAEVAAHSSKPEVRVLPVRGWTRLG